MKKQRFQVRSRGFSVPQPELKDSASLTASGFMSHHSVFHFVSEITCCRIALRKAKVLTSVLWQESDYKDP